MKFKVNDYILINDDNDCRIRGGIYQIIDIYYDFDCLDYEIVSVDDKDYIRSIYFEDLERIAEVY